MAIIKTFETHFKITTNYHRLLKVEIKAESEVVEMVVGIYLSEEARNEGGSPLWHEYVTIPFSNLNFDPRDIFYPLLKEYPDSYLLNSQDSLPPGATPHPPVFQIVTPPNQE